MQIPQNKVWKTIINSAERNSHEQRSKMTKLESPHESDPA
jgi:hypothetical protein